MPAATQALAPPPPIPPLPSPPPCSIIKFDKNACVLVNQKGLPIGTRVLGFVTHELRARQMMKARLPLLTLLHRIPGCAHVLRLGAEHMRERLSRGWAWQSADASGQVEEAALAHLVTLTPHRPCSAGLPCSCRCFPWQHACSEQPGSTLAP
jgi:hypothetical protein